MPRSTLPTSGADSFAALPPLAQWMMLESAFKELARPPLTLAVPALLIAAIPLVTGQVWSLGWLLALAAALAAGRRAAAAYDRHSVSTESLRWVRLYQLVVASQAACLGAGGLFATIHDPLPACLLAAAAIGFTLAEAAIEPLPGLVPGIHIAILAAPLALGAALRATLLHEGAGFLVLTAVTAIWAGGCVLLAQTNRLRLHTIALALREPASAVLDHAVPASPSEKDFQKLFGRDQLTGLPNRHSFLRLLALESERAVLASAPVTLLIVAWVGHAEYADDRPEVGMALVDLANCLRTALRRQFDLLASLGNGKFALLLPATDAFGGQAVAKAALAAISPEEGSGQHAVDMVAGVNQTGLKMTGPAEIGHEDASQAKSRAETTGVQAAPSHSPVVIGCATYSGKGTLAPTELLEYAEEAWRNARNTKGQTIRHYDPTGKATRPPPFKGKPPKDELRFSRTPRPSLAQPGAGTKEAIAANNPLLRIEASTVKQDQPAGVLQNQETP